MPKQIQHLVASKYIRVYHSGHFCDNKWVNAWYEWRIRPQPHHFTYVAPRITNGVSYRGYWRPCYSLTLKHQVKIARHTFEHVVLEDAASITEDDDDSTNT